MRRIWPHSGGMGAGAGVGGKFFDTENECLEYFLKMGIDYFKREERLKFPEAKKALRAIEESLQGMNTQQLALFN